MCQNAEPLTCSVLPSKLKCSVQVLKSECSGARSGVATSTTYCVFMGFKFWIGSFGLPWASWLWNPEFIQKSPFKSDWAVLMSNDLFLQWGHNICKRLFCCWQKRRRDLHFLVKIMHVSRKYFVADKNEEEISIFLLKSCMSLENVLLLTKTKKRSPFSC